MQNRNFDGMFRTALNRSVPWAADGLEGDYAVVDCARDSRIHPAVVGSRVESVCLYDGRLGRGLAAVAPYLVRLEQGSRFSNTFYEHGWNDAWGLVIRTRVGLAALRRHFRTLAYVRREAGPKLLFRYYDVRVLRTFLPTCSEQQLKQVFGPVDAFVLDGIGGVSPQIASRTEEGRLSVQEILH
ncbi:MAG: DUF4123 domain-containing protein [Nannocystales bacterium]